MAMMDMRQLKEELLKKGYTSKAILSDTEFDTLLSGARQDEGVIETPPEELRYIEGLLEIPIGRLRFFCVVPKDGDGICVCGRKMSALDIVNYAVRHGVHGRSLIRDAVIGIQPTFEIAQSGRQGECINCGRPVHTLGYFGHAYIYA